MSGVPLLGDQHRHRGQARHGHAIGVYAAVAGEHEPSTYTDEASVLGIPEHMLTAEVRQAVARLMATLEETRAQLDQCRHHEALLDEAAHRHHVLPLLDRRGMSRAVARLAAHVGQGGLQGVFVLMHVGGIERLRLTEGLAAADAALRHVAEVLSAGLARDEVAAGLGGSDFGLLLLAEPATARARARALVERVNKPAFRWRGGEVVLPVSHGLAVVEVDSTLASLLAEGDALRA